MKLQQYLLFVLLLYPWKASATEETPTACIGKEDFDQCLKDIDSCLTQCERGQGHGAGFCASFSSFFAPLVKELLTPHFSELPSILGLSDSLFLSAAYYCTSGAPYTACNYCGVGAKAGHVYTGQDEAMEEVANLHDTAVRGQKVVFEATQKMSHSLEAMWTTMPSELRMSRLFQDFDNLSFNFDLISLSLNGTVLNDFALKHFLASATSGSKSSIFGVYRRFKSLLIGHHTSSRLFASERLSIFEQDPTRFCHKTVVNSLLLMLFKIREMLFFSLKNDAQLFREERYSKYEDRHAQDQVRIDRHIRNSCSLQPTFDFMTPL